MTDTPNAPPSSGQNPPSSDGTPETLKPAPYVQPGDRWNKHKMADFLRMLAATQNVSASAKSVGMSRQSAYKLRARLKGAPFDIAWETAFQHGYDNLAQAALDRALNGVEVKHFYKGELIDTSRKFDERLTVAMLAMRNRYGVPMMGRYGAAAEFHSERWDALLERIETGAAGWVAEEPIQTDEDAVKLLGEKHAPEEPKERR